MTKAILVAVLAVLATTTAYAAKPGGDPAPAETTRQYVGWSDGVIEFRGYRALVEECRTTFGPTARVATSDELVANPEAPLPLNQLSGFAWVYADFFAARFASGFPATNASIYPQHRLSSSELNHVACSAEVTI
jgi:hypothetical protein